MTQPKQLGFGFDEILREQETAHLPSTMKEAIPLYRALIEKHHAAMIAGDEARALQLRKEGHELAVKLNGNDAAIMGGADAPAYVLERATAAPVRTVPMWGQTGDFTITIGNMQVRIVLDGMFGLGTSFTPFPGFSAHAVDYDKPFLSQTGYRSFIGCHAEMAPGITPDVFARDMIQAYVTRECKGKVLKIERGHVEREMARREGIRTGTEEKHAL